MSSSETFSKAELYVVYCNATEYDIGPITDICATPSAAESVARRRGHNGHDAPVKSRAAVRVEKAGKRTYYLLDPQQPEDGLDGRFVLCQSGKFRDTYYLLDQEHSDPITDLTERSEASERKALMDRLSARDLELLGIKIP